MPSDCDGTVSWSVTKGKIIGNATGATVKVKFGKEGAAVVTAKAGSCTKDFNVLIQASGSFGPIETPLAIGVIDETQSPLAFYTVSGTPDTNGNTLDSVWKSIQANSPNTPKAGLYKLDPNFSLDSIKYSIKHKFVLCTNDCDGKLDRITYSYKQVDVLFNTQITMPKWDGATSSTNVSCLARQEWARFYSALEEHEDGHRSLDKIIANKILNELKEASFSYIACDKKIAKREAKKGFNKLVTSIFDKYSAISNTEQNTFDVNNVPTLDTGQEGDCQ